MRFEYGKLTAEQKDDEAFMETYNKHKGYEIELFCLFLLDSISKKLLRKNLHISEDNHRELLYNLRHVDISKEALSMILNCLSMWMLTNKMSQPPLF